MLLACSPRSTCEPPGTVGTLNHRVLSPPQVEEDLGLKIEVRDQTIWKSTQNWS